MRKSFITAVSGTSVALVAALSVFGFTSPAVAAPTAAAPASVSHSASTDYSVTLVARQCASYSDIMANRARNDIQESLQDLGKNSVYRAGQPVTPQIEDPNNPACQPLNGVTFTFGAGERKNGQYSTVTATNPPVDATSVPTADGAALLDAQNEPTGQTIGGATTFTLNDAQVQRATRSNQFWVQGGTRTAPLPPRPGGGSYGFAALRCSVDNINGDNVEWIGFPASTPSTRHVFCYAYYISLPPAQGTIVIRKQLTAGSNLSQKFTFASNATYNPSGTFPLQVNNGQPAETSFVRAVSSTFGADYTFAEDQSTLEPEGWTLTSVTCTGTGATVNPTTHLVSIDLQANTTVTCTWVDDPPHDPGLTVRKVTTGGVGTFPITAQRTENPQNAPVTDPPINLTAATTTPDAPVEALPATPGVPAGTYRLTETLPASTSGTWSVTQAYCDGRVVAAATATITVVLPINGQADCTFVNAFTPHGHIILNLITRGGTGTGAFVISNTTDPSAASAADDPEGLDQTATTSTSNQATQATGDPSNQLPLLTYSIVTTPPATTSAGSWAFVSFTCDGTATTTPTSGAVSITLTSSAPTVSCTAVYTLDPPSTLQIIKQIRGDTAARSGDIVVTASCADGSEGQIDALPGTQGPFTLPEPLSFVIATTCTIKEPATGASPGTTVATSATLSTGATTAHVHLPVTVTIPATATHLTLTVTNTYTPTTTPTPPNPLGPGSPIGPTPTHLAFTGSNPTPGIAIGGGLASTGAALLLTNRRRRRLETTPKRRTRRCKGGAGQQAWVRRAADESVRHRGGGADEI